MLSLEEDRARVVDYGVPFYFDGITVAAPRPRELPRYTAMARPFRPRVWLWLGAVLALAGPVASITERPEARLSTEVSARDGYSRAALGSTVLFCLSLLLRSTTRARLPLPPRPPARFFLTGWMAFSLITSAAYTGNLVSYMTYPGRENPVNNAEARTTVTYSAVSIYFMCRIS